MAVVAASAARCFSRAISVSASSRLCALPCLAALEPHVQLLLQQPASASASSVVQRSNNDHDASSSTMAKPCLRGSVPRPTCVYRRESAALQTHRATAWLASPAHATTPLSLISTRLLSSMAQQQRTLSTQASQPPTTAPGPCTAFYDAAVASGRLQDDGQQRRLCAALDRVAADLQRHETQVHSGWLPRIFQSKTEPPRGLYVHGSVGSGKTMLMDVFYDSLRGYRKKRTHFHQFMLDVHSRIHQKKMQV